MTQTTLVISQRSYPGDARLSTQIGILEENDHVVDVLCMRVGSAPSFEKVGKTRIYRIPSLQRKRQGKIRYVLEYLTFFLPAFVLSAVLHLRRRYKLIFVTNLPDALVFTAAIPKLLGARVVFDFRECTPEMLRDRFNTQPESALMKISTNLEQQSIRFADGVLTCTEQMREALVSRGGTPSKITVTLNVGAPAMLHGAKLPEPDNEVSEKYHLVSHGSIIRRYGHEVLVEAMRHVADEIPSACLEIIGRGEMQPELERLVKRLNLEKHVAFPGFFTHDLLIPRLRAAHVGVIPTIQNPESDLSHTHKMYEYFALGIPVVISRTKSVAAYFDDRHLYFVDSGNVRQLADALIDLYHHPHKRYQLAKNALAKYEQEYSPDIQRQTFNTFIHRVLA